MGLYLPVIHLAVLLPPDLWAALQIIMKQGTFRFPLIWIFLVPVVWVMATFSRIVRTRFDANHVLHITTLRDNDYPGVTRKLIVSNPLRSHLYVELIITFRALFCRLHIRLRTMTNTTLLAPSSWLTTRVIHTLTYQRAPS